MSQPILRRKIANGLLRYHIALADTGKVLWQHETAGSSQGSPSMYEIDGREYLVITVAGPGTSGRAGRGGAEAADAAHAKLPSGYVVFALPEAK